MVRVRAPAPALALALAPLLLLLLAARVEAEPYLAVRYGYKCSQCHVNPGGGGKRNPFGSIFSQVELPQHVVSPSELGRWVQLAQRGWSGFEEEPAEDAPLDGEPFAESTFYTGYLTSFLSVGGDFRIRNRTVIRNALGDTANDFGFSQGDLYASLELLSGMLTVYLDERVAPGTVSAREVFGMLRGPWSSYLKVGRMVLPFGWRLADDSAFIRELTGFNFGAADVGAEIGFEPGPFSVSAAVTNGSQGLTDDNGDKQLTGSASFIQRYWRVGVHAAWNNGPLAERTAVGALAGLNLGFLPAFGIDPGRVTLLGEIDYIVDELEEVMDDPFGRQLLLYGAINYQLLDGVNLKFAYDFADPDTSVSDDSFIRASLGVEYTMTQFVRLRAFYRFRDDIETSPRDDESIIDLELHFYF